MPNTEEARALGRGAIAGMDSGSKGLGVALMIVGGVVLLGNLGFSHFLSVLLARTWPLILVAIGIWLYTRGRREHAVSRRTDVLDDLEAAVADFDDDGSDELSDEPEERRA